jgi:hypothetical protein
MDDRAVTGSDQILSEQIKHQNALSLYNRGVFGMVAMTQVKPTSPSKDEQSDQQPGAVKRQKPSLKAALEHAIDQLLWTSETDAPFTLVEWPNPADTLDIKILQGWLNLGPETVGECREFDEFFALATEPQDWHGEEEAAIVKRYCALVKLLKTSLTQLQVFRFGEINLEIYIVGQTAEGPWIGLQTQAVET